MYHGDLFKPRDPRPPKGGWADGNYRCTCRRCKTSYDGDKRSWECADCAYDGHHEAEALEAFDPCI
jgi:rubredoxin